MAPFSTRYLFRGLIGISCVRGIFLCVMIYEHSVFLIIKNRTSFFFLIKILHFLENRAFLEQLFRENRPLKKPYVLLFPNQNLAKSGKWAGFELQKSRFSRFSREIRAVPTFRILQKQCVYIEKTHTSVYIILIGMFVTAYQDIYTQSQTSPIKTIYTHVYLNL